MMTKQTRHHAGRAQSTGPQTGLPEPGQALIGYPEPRSSLFGVPLTTTSLFSDSQSTTSPSGAPEPTTSLFGVPQQLVRADGSPSRPPAPPRPRTPQEDYLRSRRQQAAVPRPVRRRRRWPRLLGFPLAVLVLGVALGVIAVVTLLAAGVPAPWAGSAPGTVGSTMPGQSSAASANRAQTSPAGPTSSAAVVINDDGTYLVGSQLRAGRYVTEGGVSCHWARLRDIAGTPSVVAEGNGAGRTAVWIRKADTAFATSGCTPWTRR